MENFENNKLVLYTTYELNHKTQQITVKNGLSAKVTITKAVLSINGLNGTMETYYENGKINQKVAIKMLYLMVKLRNSLIRVENFLEQE